MKYIISLLLFALVSPAIYSQEIVLGIDQPDQLIAQPGADTVICKTHTVVLGSDQVALGGSGSYYYLWYPDVYLDDPTAANPICTPEETITYMLTVTDENGCTANGFVTIAIDPCLGTGILLAEDKLQISPNPANEFIDISGLSAITGQTTIKIYNQLGQLKILKEYASPELSGSLRIYPDLDLESGLYLIHIETSQGNLIKPIQIIR